MCEQKRFIVGLTGASGAIYASRLVFHLKNAGCKVSLIATESGKTVAEYEKQESVFELADEVLDIKDFFCYAASGSAEFSGMAVVPCSMGSLGKMASGIADNLMLRAADVCLKERRPLVVVPREMPYNLIHIENMERLTRAGSIVIPASPHFYNRPQTIEELVDTVVAKIMTHLGVKNDIVKSWGK